MIYYFFQGLQGSRIYSLQLCRFRYGVEFISVVANINIAIIGQLVFLQNLEMWHKPNIDCHN